MEAPNFWDDQVVSQKKMKELKSMKDDVATYASLKTEFEDIETLIETRHSQKSGSPLKPHNILPADKDTVHEAS